MLIKAKMVIVGPTNELYESRVAILKFVVGTSSSVSDFVGSSLEKV